MSTPAVAERIAFRVSRALDYASAEELTRETGQSPELWPLVIVKELIDNALDACEEAGIAPEITVTVDSTGITVADNGPGIPPETVGGVIDMDARVSARSRYVAPDRGAQGNALKTIVFMPFVLSGTRGRVEVAARGLRHEITVGLDELRERPEVTLATAPDASVRNGTSVRVLWPPRASSRPTDLHRELYRMAFGYVLLNPHLALEVVMAGGGPNRDEHRGSWKPVDTGWRKWQPSRPTSAHWYGAERLAGLIAGYIGHDRDTGAPAPRLVRDFLALFDGLSGTTKRKAVLDTTGLQRATLRDLLGADGLNMATVHSLLAAMQAKSNRVKPAALGPIGRGHMAARFVDLGVHPDSFQYKQLSGTTAAGRPWIVEAGFGWLAGGGSRHVFSGVNWSVGLQSPFRSLRWAGDGGLDSLLVGNRVAPDDPVLVVAHLIIPGASYTDRGKSAVTLTADVARAITDAVRAVTKAWEAQKKREERDAAAAARREEILTAAARPKRMSVKAAAFLEMHKAYLKASAANTLPANARQIMYAARGAILKLTGRKSFSDAYFTQTLLPLFVQLNPELTADWDVIYGICCVERRRGSG